MDSTIWPLLLSAPVLQKDTAFTLVMTECVLIERVLGYDQIYNITHSKVAEGKRIRKAEGKRIQPL